eukprot:m.38856 g.38856  ORF g.38856 m.38856 type:complete len:331 (-) comp7890_c0_seq1:2272-3264(-)
MSAADSLEFKLALQFYKDEAITVTSLPYDTKIMLAALLKQAKHGPCDPDKEEALGWFDWVGADRRAAWEDLGDLPQDDAKAQFSNTLRESLPEFERWRTVEVDRERAAAEEAARVREQAERERKERLRKFEEDRARLERERIELLQLQQRTAAEQGAQSPAGSGTLGSGHTGPATTPSTPQTNSVSADISSSRRTAPASSVPTDANDFVAFLAKQQNPDTSIVVERGGVVKVRVPNPRPGKTVISWSFCTEDYDIGFGLEFEVAMEGDGAEEAVPKSIHPVQRIDCSKTVSSGQHCENSTGFWCLVFDNSYSIFRQKTVHFLIETGSAKQ